jgi:hypothetical protein
MHSLNRSDGAERLRALAQSADRCNDCDGADWYARKSAWIRRHKGTMDMGTAVAIYAVLSTNASVAENDINFVRVANGERARHFGSVLARVDMALAGDIAGALTFKNAAKVSTFYLNLRYPKRSDGGVTIDRHAGDILTNDRRATKAILARANLAGYREFESVYRSVAERIGARPHELQAAVWVHWVECLKRSERKEWN